MKNTLALFTLAVLTAIIGCGQSQKEAIYSSENAEADSVSTGYVSSSAIEGKVADSTKKFIKTIDLKGRVKNVVKATYIIEDIVYEANGFVTYSELKNDNQYTNTEKLSADSELLITKYQPMNTFALKVPTSQLDTTLRAIALTLEHIDYRTITAKDVAMDMLENNLALRRNANAQQNLKDNNSTAAQKAKLSAATSTDNAKLSNIKIADALKYSTINLIIYQKEITNLEVVTLPNNYESYKPSFFSRLWESLANGVYIVKEGIILLANLWLLPVLAFIIIFLIRFFNKNKNTQA